MRVAFLAMLFLVLAQAEPFAQGAPPSNLRSTVLAAADTLQFGAETILPLTVRGVARSDGRVVALTVDENQTYPRALPAELLGDSIVYSYRVLVSVLQRPYARIDSIRLLNQGALNAYDDPSTTGVSLADLRKELGAVDYRGTFGRGLRFGNSQNLVLDSRLDLQLNGDLGDGLRVAAVVSDQNIPLQPEGNTVQLQEFDQIFVTVERARNQLTVGDYSLRSDRGHFLKFDKALQGLTYRNANYGRDRPPPKDSLGYEVSASVASARGDFQRIQLPVADGNQGPYRLSGERGEAFVIVLAGTERVYLDGRLLVRGLDRDYVIDYNRGEITFTPRLLINRFQRILVEYEYIDQEYLRTLIDVEARVRQRDWTLYVQGFRQQDGLRRTGSELSPSAQALLREAEGSTEGVLVPSARPFPLESGNPIRYRLEDLTADSCGVDSIYVFAPETEVADAFEVFFTQVGLGNGEYELDATASGNGLVYRYVGRDSLCRPLGAFNPQQVVQTPQSLSLITFGGQYAPDSSLRVEWELVGNQRDLNRFSASKTSTFAGFGGISKAWILPKSQRLTVEVNGEGTGDGFAAVAPWRTAEFNRLWNLGKLATQPSDAPGSEALYDGRIRYQARRVDLSYGVDQYRQANIYKGLRQNWTARARLGRWELQHAGDRLSADRDGTETGRTFLSVSGNRSVRRLEQTFGASSLRTDNYDAVLDATTQVGRRVDEWYASTATTGSDSTWATNLTYRGRADELLAGGVDVPGPQLNHEVELSMQSGTGGNHTLGLSATYRRASADAEQADEENYYVGRVVHRYRAGKRAWLRLQTTAEAGSGQERRISIQYLKVQPGLGQYVWRDYDGDGIEDLGEFELAVFADSATYIRTVGLTDEFVATNTLTANQSLNLELSRVPTGKKKAWWRQLSALNTVNLNRRALQEAGYNRLFALSLDPADTTIVGDNLAWRSSAFLNRGRNTFRAELEHRQLSTRGISVQGLQLNRTTGQALRANQPLGTAWRIESEADQERQRSSAEGITGRDFLVRNRRISTGLVWRKGASGEVALNGSYRTGENEEGPGRVRARELKLKISLRLPEAASNKRRSPFAGATINAEARRVSQSFTGEADSAAGFALLEGLRPGQSWIWSLASNQQLGRSLQLSLRYDGRQLGGGRVVHTGQAQVQAVF